MDARVEIFRHGLRRRAAADGVQTLLGEEQAHGAEIVVLVLRRADHEVHGSALSQAQHGDGRVVVQLVEIERLHGAEHARGDALGGDVRRPVAREEVLHLGAGPAVIGRDAASGLGHAVAEEDQAVAGGEMEGALVQLLVLHEVDGIGIALRFAGLEKDGGRVVILHEAHAAPLGGDDREGGVRQMAHAADRQRRRHGGDGLLKRNAPVQHGREHRARERGEDVRLHAGAEAVGEDDRGAVAVLVIDALVAADALAVFHLADDADLPDEVAVQPRGFSHRLPPRLPRPRPRRAGSPASDRARRPSSRQPSRRGDSRSGGRCAADFP